MDDEKGKKPPIPSTSEESDSKNVSFSSDASIDLNLLDEKQNIKRKLRFHKKRIIIGSAKSCDIFLDQNSIANVHAVIEKNNDGSVTIYDMASDTGIFVNDKRVLSETLKYQDRIQIGFSFLTYEEPKEEVTVLPKSISSSMQYSGKERLHYSGKEDYTSIMIEDESEVINIFEYPAETELALQVAVYWGRTILDIQHYVDQEDILVGSSRKVDFLVPSITGSFPLVKLEGNSYVLNPNPGAEGIIRYGGKVKTIKELISDSSLISSNGKVTINRNDLVKLQFHDITIFINYTLAPPHLIHKKPFEKDALFFRCWLASLLLTVALMVAALSMEVKEPLSVEEIPPRAVAIILRPPPPPDAPIRKSLAKRLPPKTKKLRVAPKKATRKPLIPKKLKLGSNESRASKKKAQRVVRKSRVTGKKPSPGAGDAGVGARASRKQGQRGRKSSRNKGYAQTAKQGRRKDRGNKLGVGGSGIIETLKGMEGSIAKALSGGGRLQNKSGTARGYGGFTTQGKDGLGEIGTGTGGSGKSQTVAGLGTSGVGAGKVGKGKGAIGSGGHLYAGGRSQPLVSIPASGESVVSGGLGKNIINQVMQQYLNQIRFCYEKGLNTDPNLKGKIVTRFVINRTGRVSRAAVLRHNLKNKSVRGCVLTVIKRIVFPEVEGGGIVEVDYPFIFSPSAKI